MNLKIGIISLAVDLPKTKVSGESVALQFGHAPEYYQKEVGLDEKRLAVFADEHPSDMCARAGQKAIWASEIDPNLIGTVIYTSTSRDYLPAWCGATETIGRLGLKNAYGFDLNLGCAGTLVALSHATKIYKPEFPYTLIVSAERWTHTLSAKVDLPMGTSAHADGGAAALIGPSTSNEIRDFEHILLPEYNAFIHVPAGGTQEPASQKTLSENRHFRTRRFDIRVTDIYVENYKKVIQAALNKMQIDSKDLALLIMNQGRSSLRREIANYFKIPEAACPSTFEKLGHVGAADLFLVLEKYFSENLAEGDCLLVASNVSFYGALALRFGKDTAIPVYRDK